MSLASLSPRVVFLSGANRGIGLELVKQFLKLPNPPACLVATYRNPDNSKELREIAEKNNNVHALKLDVTDYASLPNVVKQVASLTGGAGVNLLINNSGVLQYQNTIDDVTVESLRESFEINTVAPMMLTKAFVPLLKKAAAASSDKGLSCSRAAIINISSKVGSCADNTSGRMYAYRVSKTALNMVTKTCSVELRPEGVLAAVLHPGWVQTDLGGPNAILTTEQWAQGMINVMAAFTDKHTGTFYDYKGEEILW